MAITYEMSQECFGQRAATEIERANRVGQGWYSPWEPGEKATVCRFTYAEGLVFGTGTKSWGDGDFDDYVRYWNPVKCAVEQDCYFTNRFGMGFLTKFTIDITPDMKEHMEACEENAAFDREKARRKEVAYFLREQRAKFIKRAANVGVKGAARIRLQKWFRGLEEDLQTGIINLLSPKLRSDFRKSLRDQIVDWALDAGNMYGGPLSPKQLGYARPRDYNYRAFRGYGSFSRRY